jgi:type I restriction enzyme S subunit
VKEVERPLRRFKKYPAYKDSGVEWLGEIPAGWEAKRLKLLLAAPLKYGANEAAELDNPDLPRYVRITDIDENDHLRDETFKSLPTEVAAEYLLREGDLLLARSGATAGKTFLYRKSWGTCAYAGYLIRARLDTTMAFPPFARYFTASSAYWQWLSSVFIQATIQNVSAERYAGLVIPQPHINEQARIAKFLDRETARIDGLVAKKERLIELLQEKRTALITRAVTKGLDPTVPMKDSGVEWLGRIPAHWEVKRLRWAFSIRSGEALPNTEFELSEEHGLSVAVVGGNGIMGYTDRANIDEPSVVIGRVGALCGNVHLVDPPAWITDNALVLSGIVGFDRRYLALLLRVLDLNQWANQNAQPLITGGLVKAQLAPTPPVQEQRAVIAFVDHETTRIDALIAKVREAIVRLKEFRTALITAAVTGKIDVREEVA